MRTPGWRVAGIFIGVVALMSAGAVVLFLTRDTNVSESKRVLNSAEVAEQRRVDAFDRRGTVSGIVRLIGDPPKEMQIAVDQNTYNAHGGKALMTRHFVTGANGGLANVVLFVESDSTAFSQISRTEPAVMKIRGSLYEPFVLGIRTNHMLEVWNMDPYSHNVMLISKRNRNVNKLSFAKAGSPVELSLSSEEGFVKLVCDVHPWEIGYVAIFDHPQFAVTGPEGEFRLPFPLEPGKHVLVAIHPKAGRAETEVTVHSGVNAAVTVEMRR